MRPELLQALAAEARALVARRFGWAQVAAATEALYDDVLQGARP